MFVVFVSVVPAAGETEAVFTSVPMPAGVLGFRVAVNVKVADVPEGSVTVEEMFPVPLGAPHVAPDPVGAHVHVAFVSALGSVSATVRPVTTDGPAFDATIV